MGVPLGIIHLNRPFWGTPHDELETAPFLEAHLQALEQVHGEAAEHQPSSGLSPIFPWHLSSMVGFPFRHGGTRSHHPFLGGIFHEININQPTSELAVPPICGTPPSRPSASELSVDAPRPDLLRGWHHASVIILLPGTGGNGMIVCSYFRYFWIGSFIIPYV